MARETNVSDLIQLLSDRDPTPWQSLIGFIPDDVLREVSSANNADLLLSNGTNNAVLEVKLGHLMSTEQQAKYEQLGSEFDLYLAALEDDKARLAKGAERWRFVSLSDLFSHWESSRDEFARHLAGEIAGVLKDWDRTISGTLNKGSAQGGVHAEELTQKFLARVVTRRMATDLEHRGHHTFAGVTSGGGLPLVASWTPVRGEGMDRTFIAEVRWWENKPGGELRFGVDFSPRKGQEEDEEVRRAAYNLATGMDSYIDHDSLQAQLTSERPDLSEALHRNRRSRPKPRGDWERVIVHGFAGAPLEDGRRNNRLRTRPAFYGDGTLRFQAISNIDFSRVSAFDLVDLIDLTLKHLTTSESHLHAS